MKIYELVSEAFTSKIPYDVVRSTNDLFTTKATIGDRVIVFNAAANEEGTQGNIVWEVDFYEKTPGNITFSKTGSGGEMQVFSFVIDSLKELASRHHPETIRFSSHKADMNRSKLYQRMIAKIAPSLGYQLADLKTATGFTGSADDVFVLKRISK
jgi:hypothetical protein